MLWFVALCSCCALLAGCAFDVTDLVGFWYYWIGFCFATYLLGCAHYGFWLGVLAALRFSCWFVGLELLGGLCGCWLVVVACFVTSVTLDGC